jgi:hypothetical protein
VQFLGLFGKLRKATISFVMSVRPSARPHWNTSAPTGGIFMNFDIRVFFENLSKKVQVSLISDNYNENFT